MPAAPWRRRSTLSGSSTSTPGRGSCPANSHAAGAGPTELRLREGAGGDADGWRITAAEVAPPAVTVLVVKAP
jgi:hypothetical protein